MFGFKGSGFEVVVSTLHNVDRFSVFQPDDFAAFLQTFALSGTGTFTGCRVLFDRFPVSSFLYDSYRMQF